MFSKAQIILTLSDSETSFMGVKKVMIHKSMSCFRRDKIDNYNDKKLDDNFD